MIVAGVDSSLRSTGIAIVDLGVGVIETRNVQGAEVKKTAPFQEHVDRMTGMHKTVMLALEDVDVVAIENLSFGSQGNARTELAGLWWLLRTSLETCGVRVVEVAPQERAKYATGNGRADKHDVLAAVRAEYPDADVPNHDVADAIALAARLARLMGEPIDRDMEWRVGAGMKGMGA